VVIKPSLSSGKKKIKTKRISSGRKGKERKKDANRVVLSGKRKTEDDW